MLDGPTYIAVQASERAWPHIIALVDLPEFLDRRNRRTTRRKFCWRMRRRRPWDTVLYFFWLDSRTYPYLEKNRPYILIKPNTKSWSWHGIFFLLIFPIAVTIEIHLDNNAIINNSLSLNIRYCGVTLYESGRQQREEKSESILPVCGVEELPEVSRFRFGGIFSIFD